MGKTVKGLLGVVGLGGGTPKVDGKAATAPIDDDVESSKKARQALLETQGGIVGEELDPTQVKKRDNIFGN